MISSLDSNIDRRQEYLHIILFILLYCLALITHVLLSDSYPAIPLVMKIAVVVIFVVLVWKHPENGISLLIGSIIIFGVNGTFHRATLGIPFPVILLFILISTIFCSREQRHFLKYRLQNSALSIPVLVGGILVPCIGVTIGLIYRNAAGFVIKDADGWIMYLLFFCLICFIRSRKHFRAFLIILFTSFIFSAFFIISSAILYYCRAIKIVQLSTFLYDTLRLGGHLETGLNVILRIYTGTGLFLPYSLGITFLIILFRRKILPAWWGLLFFILLYTTLISWTRGYWIASLMAGILIVVHLPRRLKLRIIECGLILLILAIIIIRLNTQIPLNHIVGQFWKDIRGAFLFSKTETIYIGKGNTISLSTDGGRTWARIWEGMDLHFVWALDIDKRALQTVFAGTGGGVYRSTDGGIRWSAMNEGLSSTKIHALAIDKEKLNTIYVNTDKGYFLSTNGGKSWRQLSQDAEIPEAEYLVYWSRNKFKNVGIAGQSVYRCTDRTRSISIKIRQYRSLIKRTIQKPFFGFGFGATLPDGATFRRNNDPKPNIFEAGYADMLMKVGFLGIGLWLSFVICLYRTAYCLYKTSKWSCRFLIMACCFPQFGLLVAYGTNPYLYSPFGIIPLVITAFIVDFIHYSRMAGGQMDCSDLIRGIGLSITDG